jgi:hypothetical protein
VSQRSFLDRIERERLAQRIYLIRGQDSTGKKAWYYLLVTPGQNAQFEESAGRGQMQLTEFGRILRSGYGESPPEDVRNRMRDEYGFEG